MIVTIDGHAGSGKSTVAHALASRLGFELMNTGAMYRAVALLLTRQGHDLFADRRDPTEIARILEPITFEMNADRIRMNGEDLTEQLSSETLGRGASRVGTFREVRVKLQAEQRRLAVQRDIVCEGRDQGTAVFPDAPVKFFVTAAVDVRARRRAAQLGIDPEAEPTRFAELVEQIRRRDEQDENRDLDPLRAAKDAIHLDTSTQNPEETLACMMEVVERCRNRR